MQEEGLTNVSVEASSVAGVIRCVGWLNGDAVLSLGQQPRLASPARSTNTNAKERGESSALTSQTWSKYKLFVYNRWKKANGIDKNRNGDESHVDQIGQLEGAMIRNRTDIRILFIYLFIVKI